MTTAQGLEQQPASVRAKLAAAWTSFMFLYIYVDYLNLYVPGVIEDITNGVVWRLDISQTFVVSGLALVAIPIVMIGAVHDAAGPSEPCDQHRRGGGLPAGVDLQPRRRVLDRLLRPRRCAGGRPPRARSSARPGCGPEHSPTLQTSRRPPDLDSTPTPDPSMS